MSTIKPVAWCSQSPIGGSHFSRERPTGPVEQYPQYPLYTLTDAQLATLNRSASDVEQAQALQAQRDALLEALRGIVAFVDGPAEGQRPDVWLRLVDNARAALAAEGE